MFCLCSDTAAQRHAWIWTTMHVIDPTYRAIYIMYSSIDHGQLYQMLETYLDLEHEESHDTNSPHSCEPTMGQLAQTIYIKRIALPFRKAACM